MPFPKVAKGLEELVDHIERLIGHYNSNLAEGLDRLAILLPDGKSSKSCAPFSLDLSSPEKLIEHAVVSQVTYLVDLAKVEALDTKGENRKAVELLERHA